MFTSLLDIILVRKRYIVLYTYVIEVAPKQLINTLIGRYDCVRFSRVPIHHKYMYISRTWPCIRAVLYIYMYQIGRLRVTAYNIIILFRKTYYMLRAPPSKRPAKQEAHHIAFTARPVRTSGYILFRLPNSPRTRDLVPQKWTHKSNFR